MTKPTTSAHLLSVVGFLLIMLVPEFAANAAEQSDGVYKRVVRSVVAIAPRINGGEPTIGTGWILDASAS